MDGFEMAAQSVDPSEPASPVCTAAVLERTGKFEARMRSPLMSNPLMESATAFAAVSTLGRPLVISRILTAFPVLRSQGHSGTVLARICLLGIRASIIKPW